MDIGVAAGAWCQLGRSRAHPVNRRGSDRTVALVAQRIHIGHVQEPRILRAMWSVTPKTALGLDHGMLVNKRPTCLRVALGADRILIGSGLEIVIAEGAMWIVAVGTLN